MTPHPGKTAAQREALDRIGCGDSLPPMHRRTMKVLLDAGLIMKVGEKRFGRDALGSITIPEYGMPVPVHMQWCEHWAELEELERADG